MPTPFSDLTTPPTEVSVREHLLNLMRTAGMPTAAWEPGSLPRTMLTVEAAALTELAAFVSETARAAFLSTAEGDWLSRHGEEVFDLPRKPGIAAEGIVTLVDAGNVGPLDFDPAACVFQLGSLRYNALGADGAAEGAPFTLPRGGRVAVRLRADSVGSRYTVAVDPASLRWTTPRAGVTVASAAAFIVVPGVDPEGDEEYRARCLARWATLGTGTNAEALAWTALSADPTIRRHSVTHDPATGIVTVTLAAANGTVGTEAVARAIEALAVKRPLCMTIATFAAREHVVGVVGTITARSGAALDVLATRVPEALAALAGRYRIGETVYLSQVVGALQAIEGVEHVALTSPSATETLSPEEVVVFDSAGLNVTNGTSTLLVVSSRSLPTGLAGLGP